MIDQFAALNGLIEWKMEAQIDALIKAALSRHGIDSAYITYLYPH